MGSPPTTCYSLIAAFARLSKARRLQGPVPQLQSHWTDQGGHDSISLLPNVRTLRARTYIFQEVAVKKKLFQSGALAEIRLDGFHFVLRQGQLAKLRILFNPGRQFRESAEECRLRGLSPGKRGATNRLHVFG